MFLVILVVCVLAVNVVGASECPPEVKVHAHYFVTEICDKLGGIEGLQKIAKCKREANHDVKLPLSQCSLELGIPNLDQPQVAYDHFCKEGTIEKRVENTCCAIKAGLQKFRITIEKMIEVDKECWKHL